MPKVVPLTDLTSTIWPSGRVPFHPIPPSHHVQRPSLPAMLTKLESVNSVTTKYWPTEIPPALLTVMLVDPAVAPPVIATEPEILGSPLPRVITPPPEPFAFRIV